MKPTLRFGLSWFRLHVDAGDGDGAFRRRHHPPIILMVVVLPAPFGR